jgi:hypothetical protein
MPSPERLPDITEAVARYTHDLESHINRMAREIQELEDREILSVLERTGTFANGTGTFTGDLQNTRLDLAAIRETLERMPLPQERLFVSEQDYLDILAFSNEERRRILPVTAPPVGFTVREEPGVGIVNPRAVRRVVVPEFELSSNPTIRIDEVRQRRFDLIDRTHPVDPAAKRILDALIAKKRSQSWTPVTRIPGPPRSVWEALVDLDLVDADVS